MEITKVLPEDLSNRFRSKQDLYRLLKFDLSYLLPAYNYCPLHFLRKVLSGDKKLLKIRNVTNIVMPRYSELSVEEIWPMIKEVADIMVYFPDYSDKQMPDRDYMYSILATTRYEQLKEIVDNSRKQRAKDNILPDDEFVYIEKNILSEIEEVMAQKTTKGNAHYLLKKCSKLKRDRKHSKKYSIDISNLRKTKEMEEKDEEDKMQ